MLRYIYSLVFLGFFTCLLGQPISSDSLYRGFRSASIFRIAVHTMPPEIDGDLSDDVWKAAREYSGFTLFEPNPGAACSRNTYFRLLYDDNAIYIYARMEDDPANILKELAPRDQYNNTDYIEFFFDPYASGTVAFSFAVTPRNLQRDTKYIGSQEEDESWDAIWDSAVQSTEDGWQAEFRIPFSQLRFPEEDVQQWRFNVVRQMKKVREKSSWQILNPAISGLINQNGYLSGISHLKSPMRLSLFPYLSAYYAPEAGAKMKFAGGLDLKYGINDAFTLDMTLIPDFGQVAFDNIVYNLTPFEVQYEERRPFFTEGLELFSRAELFYSRRIAADNHYFDRNGIPSGKTLVEVPAKNKLINAFKLTGRASNGLGVGILNALEGRSHAVLKDDKTGQTERIPVNPISNYNIIVVDQNLRNNSYISFINTNVMRQGEHRDGNVTGAELNIRSKNQAYYIKAIGALSYISQGREAKPGYKYAFSTGKNSGNWTTSIEYEEISRRFDPTDLGYLKVFNTRAAEWNLGYSTYIPRGIRNKSTTSLSVNYERVISPDRFSNFGIEGEYFFLDRNFNALNLDLGINPIITYDFYEPRSGDFSRFYTFPIGYEIGGFISTDYRRPLALDMNFGHRHVNEAGRNYYQINADPRMRFNDHFSIFATIGFERGYNDVGYAYTIRHEDEPWQVNDIIFSRRNVQTVVLGFNPVLLINPNLNFSLRVRNYWSQVSIKSLHLLETDGYLSEDEVAGGNYPLFQLVQFTNFEARANWRFAPGSDLILAWNSGYDKFTNEDSRYWSSYSNFGNRIRNNIISVRVNYYLDYARLFRK